MSTPAIPHFGTTIIEAAPPAGAVQRDVPITGALQRTLEFLTVLGFQPLVENFYEGMGRQYIWSRGEHADADYVEQDNFTSYAATDRPATDGPREGDTIFRLTHQDPLKVLAALREKELIEVDEAAADSFLAGGREWLLFKAPNGQRYEFGASQPARSANHTIYIWTADERLEQVRERYQNHFGVASNGVEDFHSLGRVERLSRDEPGLTIGLLHSPSAVLHERWTDDIFKEAGYSHFRLGALNKQGTETETRQAFPSAGDVAFVYFEDSYLELVQA
jgi:hypothetical protein